MYTIIISRSESQNDQNKSQAVINLNYPVSLKTQDIPFNVISLSKLPASAQINNCSHMITSRAAAVQTVYHVDRGPDRLLMRFCKKMQFSEMTELIVL